MPSSSGALCKPLESVGHEFCACSLFRTLYRLSYLAMVHRCLRCLWIARPYHGLENCIRDTFCYVGHVSVTFDAVIWHPVLVSCLERGLPSSSLWFLGHKHAFRFRFRVELWMRSHALPGPIAEMLRPCWDVLFVPVANVAGLASFAAKSAENLSAKFADYTTRNSLIRDGLIVTF
jgi:hypothetical protein